MPPFVVTAAREWFDAHGFKCIRTDHDNFNGETVYEFYSCNGVLVLLVHRKDWADVFVPVTDSNSSIDTFKALKKRLNK